MYKCGVLLGRDVSLKDNVCIRFLLTLYKCRVLVGRDLYKWVVDAWLYSQNAVIETKFLEGKSVKLYR